MPERLRQRIVERCGALTAEQQQMLIEFIWLREHAPLAKGERIQRRLMDLLEHPGIDAERISNALREAVEQLQRALSASRDAAGSNDPV